MLEAGIERGKGLLNPEHPCGGLGRDMLMAPLMTPHLTFCLLRPEMRAGLDLASVYDAPD